MPELRVEDVTQTMSERVAELANHLLRAGKAHKAALLFATYLSEFTRSEADAQLEKLLQEQGETIVRVRINLEDETSDLPLYLRNHPQCGQAIFFIHGLMDDGETAVTTLNYRREYLVEDQQRLLCWVHESEIGKLARTAPDFWAFRGRTISFLEQTNRASQNDLLSNLTFFNYHGSLSPTPADLEDSIRLRQTLLDKLPQEAINNASRCELLYTLAIYHDMAQKADQGLTYLEEARQLAQTAAPYLLPYIYNAQGNILHRMGEHNAALSAYDRSLDLAPDEAGTHSNRGNALTDLGRYEDALEAFGWALQLEPTLANAHNGKGNCYLHLGRYEEALPAFDQALQFAPQSAYIYNNQGSALRDMDRQEEALRAFNKATEIDPNYAIPWLNKALLAMQQQKPEEALHDLTIGLQKAPQYRQWVVSRPAFVSLRATAQFKTAVRL